MADHVKFHFDPACPWTWITSRWLVEVADHSDVEVEWRAFSLPMLNAGNETPEKFKAGMALSKRALRVIERLAAQGRQEDIARFYTSLGHTLHVEGRKAEPGFLDTALRDAGVDGVDELLAVADDEGADAAVAKAHHAAVDAVGPDVGSPVLFTPKGNAIFGPIVSSAPKGKDAVSLWRSAEALADTPAFFELKRGRTERADFS